MPTASTNFIKAEPPSEVPEEIRDSDGGLGVAVRPVHLDSEWAGGPASSSIHSRSATLRVRPAHHE